MRQIKLGLCVGLVFVALGISACGAIGDVDFLFTNDDTQEIHLFYGAESFDASNKLQSGETRSATQGKEEFVANETTITAGRNGTAITTKTCTVSSASKGFDMAVKWDGTTITCTRTDSDD